MNATNICIIGASGALGGAFIQQCQMRYKSANIHAFSRSEYQARSANITAHPIDLTDEVSIQLAADIASKSGPIDLVIVATGLLHDGDLMPEKSLRDLSADKFAKLFAVNTTGPSLVAKHFLPHFPRDRNAIFAALSARVGSISDNGLGGWYAYRASKAALNMVLKNASIEMARRYPHAIVVGLHPGTVDSNLSEPFQGNVAEGKLFSPDFAAEKLMDVLEGLTPENSGGLFAWDGLPIGF